MQATAIVIFCAILYVNTQEIVNFLQERLNEKEATIYRHKFLTSNDIRREEAVHVPQGDNPEILIRGCYSYTSPEGHHIAVEYIGNKDGFRLPNGFKFGYSNHNRTNLEECQGQTPATRVGAPPIPIYVMKIKAEERQGTHLVHGIPGYSVAGPVIKGIPVINKSKVQKGTPGYPSSKGEPLPSYVLKSMIGEMKSYYPGYQVGVPGLYPKGLPGLQGLPTIQEIQGKNSNDTYSIYFQLYKNYELIQEVHEDY